MSEFKRHVSDRVPSHLIYIPEMKLISRDELIAVLKPERITEEDISKHEGWSRQSIIELKLVPDLLKYAILSHRWGESELTFQDAKSGICEGAGYEKLHEFCGKAKENGCLLAWSDTCCINKESSSELDEAIRSMYRWYRDAYICIVHLAQSQSLETLGSDEWILRGWTLQELLAPLRMKFYGPRWTPLTQNENDKDDAAVILTLSRVTKIPPNDLCDFRPGPNRAWEKMTWAARRKTTRIEDIAYSLTGIFDISMPIAYGEGDRAFKRFIAELIQSCKEWQILVWAGGLPGYPTDPACYYTANEAVLEMLKNRQISWWGEGRGDSDFSITKRGVQVRLLMVPTSVDESLEQSTFLHRPAGRLEAPPLEKLVVPFHFFPPTSTTEWAIGIVNYHDHRDVDKGKLKRGQSYICFLFTRSRRPGVDTMRNYWRREVTEDIMTVSCANDLEQILETVWL
ncbi:heterokaryon incompatibility protein-domain-containing protein [Suillus lakei]|nr:heterokaryon incompatibility protein-domain-containing protein [Suillus lakei]